MRVNFARALREEVTLFAQDFKRAAPGKESAEIWDRHMKRIELIIGDAVIEAIDRRERDDVQRSHS